MNLSICPYRQFFICFVILGGLTFWLHCVLTAILFFVTLWYQFELILLSVPTSSRARATGGGGVELDGSWIRGDFFQRAKSKKLGCLRFLNPLLCSGDFFSFRVLMYARAPPVFHFPPWTGILVSSCRCTLFDFDWSVRKK